MQTPSKLPVDLRFTQYAAHFITYILRKVKYIFSHKIEIFLYAQNKRAENLLCQRDVINCRRLSNLDITVANNDKSSNK